MKIKAIINNIKKYNIPQLSKIPEDRSNGMIGILVCQMGGCTSKEIQKIMISAMKQLIRRHNINLIAFIELNYNWSKVNFSASLLSWLYKEEQETRWITAHNM
jgi:hypothetical protein